MIYRAKVTTEFVTDLDGQPIERPKTKFGAVVFGEDGKPKIDLVSTWGDLATVCANAQKKDALKCYTLATRFQARKPFEIDKSDKELVVQCVKDAGFSALLEAQLLAEIDSWKEAKDAGSKE